MRYAGLGIELAVAIVAGTFGGRWLDHKLGTDGIFTIVGALLGFGGTLYSVVRELSKTGQDKHKP